VVATQLVSDLMGRGGVYGPGRIIIESCSTKIVLKQDQAASQVLKEAFNLSDGEEKFIVNAKIGQGILVTQEGRIPSTTSSATRRGDSSPRSRRKSQPEFRFQPWLSPQFS